MGVNQSPKRQGPLSIQSFPSCAETPAPCPPYILHTAQFPVPFTHMISGDSPKTHEVGRSDITVSQMRSWMLPQVACMAGGSGLWTWWQRPEVHVHGCFLGHSESRYAGLPVQPDGLLQERSGLHLGPRPPTFCHLTGGRYYVPKGETGWAEIISGTASTHSCLNSALGRGGWEMGSLFVPSQNLGAPAPHRGSVLGGPVQPQWAGSKLARTPAFGPTGIQCQSGASSSDCP